MSIFKGTVCAVVLGLSASALAAPPTGHPSVEQAGQALKLPPSEAELHHQGKVVQTIPSNEYVYIEVQDGAGHKRWLAAPATELQVGDTIRYPEGTVMSNFYSKRLKRGFDEVVFVGRIKVLGQ
ncbi:MAG TPA: hypothetical protein VGE00_07190 [Gammaproteobacteria bacterium]